MAILLVTVFVASLLGSLHCVGMCGPFALLASVDPLKRNAAVAPTMAYSFGRLVTYSIIGFSFGSLGLAFNRGTSFSSWQQSATYLAGGLMIVVGAISLARHLGMKIVLPSVPAPVQGLLQKGFQRTRRMAPISRATAIGMLTSLMPCGWLYTFALTAAGTGSPLWGTLLMLAFWAGTVPVMTALVFGFNRIGQGIRQKIPVVMATLVIGLGIITMIHRNSFTLPEQKQIGTGIDALVERVESLDHSQLPCCSEQ